MEQYSGKPYIPLIFCPDVDTENVFLPFESENAFPSEPIAMVDALLLLNDSFTYVAQKAARFNRFDQDYFIAVNDLITTVTQTVRGIVTIVKMEPERYIEKMEPLQTIHQMLCIISYQIRKTKAAFDASKKNPFIRDEVVLLQFKLFTLLQRLYATQQWEETQLGKYTDGVLSEQDEKEPKQKSEKKPKTGEEEPAPLQGARPILPLSQKLDAVRAINKSTQKSDEPAAQPQTTAQTEITPERQTKIQTLLDKFPIPGDPTFETSAIAEKQTQPERVKVKFDRETVLRVSAEIEARRQRELSQAIPLPIEIPEEMRQSMTDSREMEIVGASKQPAAPSFHIPGFGPASPFPKVKLNSDP